MKNPCYFGVALNLLDNILQFLNGLFIKRSFFLIEYFLSPAFPCNEHDSAPNFSIHTIICTHTRSTIDKVTQVHDRAVIEDACLTLSMPGFFGAPVQGGHCPTFWKPCSSCTNNLLFSFSGNCPKLDHITLWFPWQPL